MKRVRILLADDHEVVRRGLRSLLEARPGWRVVGEALDGTDALAQARRLKPHVAVLDVTMPGLSGLEVARRMPLVSPATEVLILTMHESQEVVREVVAAGARGYVLKSDAGVDLVMAVEALLRHQPFISSRAAVAVAEAYRKASAPGNRPSDGLTPREREVVGLLARGRSNKETAAILGISPKTVEAHRASSMRKLAADGLADLVRYAVRHGLAPE